VRQSVNMIDSVLREVLADSGQTPAIARPEAMNSVRQSKR
jgi:hypothetical protein